jgi:hypothetical protein
MDLVHWIQMMQPTESSTDNSPREADATHASASTWAVSLTFWTCLLIASGLYAAVALAPKLSVWIQVRHQYIQNARQLISLEEEVEYLERVCEALEKDPEFVRRLASAERAVDSGNSEFVPVSGSLVFGGVSQAKATGPAASEPEFGRLASTLATHQTLRKVLLAVSAGMVILGFTFLNDSGSNLVRSAFRIVSHIAVAPVQRYLMPADEQETSDIEPEPAEPDGAID